MLVNFAFAKKKKTPKRGAHAPQDPPLEYLFSASVSPLINKTDTSGQIAVHDIELIKHELFSLPEGVGVENLFSASVSPTDQQDRYFWSKRRA